MFYHLAVETISSPPVASSLAAASTSVSGGRQSWQSELGRTTVLLAMALGFAFFPVVCGDKTVLHSAIGTATIMPYGAFGNTSKISVDSHRTTDAGAPAWAAEPWLKLTHDLLFAEHSVPLWNPYSGCGAPFLANMQSQVMLPLNIIASAFASPVAYDLFVVGRLLLAGLFTYGAARLWTTPPCALIAAVIYMLGGYHLGLANMSEVSVSMMLPAVFAATELIIRRRNFASMAAGAGSVALTLYGGMPELAFLVLLFTCTYAAFRVFAPAQANKRGQSLALLAVAYSAGLALAAPQVLPFVEYMRFSHNMHDPSTTASMSGLAFDSDWQRGLLTYLLPGSLRIPNYNVNFWGIGSTFLCLLAAGQAFNNLKNSDKTGRANQAPILFLFTVAVLMIGKRFGIPAINYFGALPVANMVIFPKYGEPIIGLCVGLLAALGAQALINKQIEKRAIITYGALLTAGIGYLLFCYHNVPQMPELDGRGCLSTAIICGAGALIILAASCLFSQRRPAWLQALPYVIVLLFLGEISAGYLIRAHFAPNSFASRSADPYAGAPYIRFLQQKTARSHERVFATDFLLMPNWSAAFQLADMRTLDAIYPDRYFNLLSSFFPGAQDNSELYDRFFGAESYVTKQMRQPAERQALFHRLCALTSTAYIASAESLPTRANLLDIFALGNSANGRTFKKEIALKEKQQSVLFQRAEASPNQTLLKAAILVPQDSPYLRVGMLVDPDLDSGLRPGPGVIFDAYVAAPGSGLQPVLHEQSTPINQKDKTRTTIIDLRKFAGKRIELRLASTTVAKQPDSARWIAWSTLEWCLADGTPTTTEINRATEQLIYNSEAKIYAISPILPRAALFNKIEIAATERAVLQELLSPSFNPFNSAILEQDDLPLSLGKTTAATPAQSLITRLQQAAPEQCQSASIESYSANKIKIRCAPTQPVLLLLNDIYYPGWTALVDGEKNKILKANYCFRGVLLQPGDHSVEFIYDPITFRLGLWLAAISAGLIIMFGLLHFKRKVG